MPPFPIQHNDLDEETLLHFLGGNHTGFGLFESIEPYQYQLAQKVDATLATLSIIWCIFESTLVSITDTLLLTACINLMIFQRMVVGLLTSVKSSE